MGSEPEMEKGDLQTIIRELGQSQSGGVQSNPGK